MWGGCIDGRVRTSVSCNFFRQGSLPLCALETHLELLCIVYELLHGLVIRVPQELCLAKLDRDFRRGILCTDDEFFVFFDLVDLEELRDPV